MATELEMQLSHLKQGDHLCLIYESAAEQLAAAVPFVKEGLARRERCMYIADDRAVEDVVQALTAGGVDVVHERERGAIWMLTKQESYLRSGKFDPQAMIEFLRSAQAQSLADGFAGLRVAAEMTWALGPEIGCDRVIEYESLLNDFLANGRSLILCQYNRERFDAAVIHDVVRTHPIVVVGDYVCRNPYFEPPALFHSPGRPSDAEFKRKRADWWISQLKRARAAEQERERVLELLKQNERRLSEAQLVAHIGSWERDLRTDQVTWSDELYRLFGLQPRGVELSYQKFLDLLAPQDVARIHLLVQEAIRDRRPFSVDYRINRTDGSIRVLHDRGALILNDVGEPIRLVGTAQDVTDVRQTEEALQENSARLKALSRRLLDVQETERRHLARELHDEIGQLLTSLRWLLKPDRNFQSQEGQSKLERAITIVDDLLDKIRGLSFDLRPAVLDLLGLFPALHALFESFTKQTGVQVSFRNKDVEKRRFTHEVETTAYRIVQEALTNVARHAQVAGATVRAWTTDDTLGIQIEDHGRGFDPEAALGNMQSSGLAGMRERISLLNGQLTIDSRPGAGTQITAELPLRHQTSKEESNS